MNKKFIFRRAISAVLVVAMIAASLPICRGRLGQSDLFIGCGKFADEKHRPRGVRQDD